MDGSLRAGKFVEKLPVPGDKTFCFIIVYLIQ